MSGMIIVMRIRVLYRVGVEFDSSGGHEMIIRERGESRRGDCVKHAPWPTEWMKITVECGVSWSDDDDDDCIKEGVIQSLTSIQSNEWNGSRRRRRRQLLLLLLFRSLSPLAKPHDLISIIASWRPRSVLDTRSAMHEILIWSSSDPISSTIILGLDWNRREWMLNCHNQLLSFFMRSSSGFFCVHLISWSSSWSKSWSWCWKYSQKLCNAM